MLSNLIYGRGGKPWPGRIPFLRGALIIAFLALFPGLAVAASDRITVYFYADEFANNTVTCHMWQKTDGADDLALTQWESRPALQFTGKKLKVGEEYFPVYTFNFGIYDYSGAPTNILFRREARGDVKAVATPDLDFKAGALYNINGLVQENFDESELVDIAEGEYDMHTYKAWLYLGTRLNYNWSYTQTVNGNPYDEELANVRVHVWGPSGDLTAYAFNGHPKKARYYPEGSDTPGDIYTWIDGPRYETLYEYSFRYFGDEPEGILFRCNYSDNVYDEAAGGWVYKPVTQQTPDQEFHNGALYNIERHWTVHTIPNPEIYEGIPTVTGSVYLIDTDAAVYNIFGCPFSINDDPYVFFPRDDSFGPYYTELNGRWYPVYKYNLGDQYSPTPMPKTFKVINPASYTRKRESAPLEFRVDGVYRFGGNGVVTPVMSLDELTLVDAIPESPAEAVTVYAHLGANQIMEKELWEVPYCMPFKRTPGNDPYNNHFEQWSFDSGYSIFPAEDATEEDGLTPKLEKYRMTEVSPGMYTYTFTPTEDYDDFIFFYYYDATEPQQVIVNGQYQLDENGNPIIEMVKNGKRAVGELTASRSPYFNPTQLTDYVYDIGVDCFHQSYLTPDEFLRQQQVRAANEVPAVYLSGNETVTGHAEDDPRYAVEIKEDHGCFFIDFEVADDSPASFKVSTVNVPAIAAELGDAYCFQRGWASFNLGLVGCDFPVRKEGETDEVYQERYDQWYSSHVVKPGGANSNREIEVCLNEAYSYNDYCQYPWRVEVNPDHGMAAGHYWMVVDLLPEDQSVALLDFDPHPHCNATDITVRQERLSNAMAQAIHNRQGVGLAGVAHAGLSALLDVNVASGKIEIGDTGNTLIGDEGFENTYTIYLDDRAAYRCTGRPDYIEVDRLDVSDNAAIAIRGRFYDKKSDRYFATRYSYGSVDFSVGALPAPSVKHNDNAVVRYGNGTVSAIDDMEITLPQSSYTAYPDFRVKDLRIDGALTDEYSATLVHSNHPMQESEASQWASHLGWTMGDGDGWVPFDGEGEISDRNNWAEYMKAEKHMPLTFDIADFDSKRAMNPQRQNDIVAYVEALASYPFLVYYPDKVIEIEGASGATDASVRRVAKAPVTGYTADNSKYVVLSTSLGMGLDFGSGQMTGVDSAAADAPADAPAEYFNLQGIRVDGRALTPGVYIERRGAASRKILVK